MLRPKVVYEPLFVGTVVAAQNVPHGSSTHKVANLFGNIIDMVAGTLQSLRHEQHMKTLRAPLFVSF